MNNQEAKVMESDQRVKVSPVYKMAVVLNLIAIFSPLSIRTYIIGSMTGFESNWIRKYLEWTGKYDSFRVPMVQVQPLWLKAALGIGLAALVLFTLISLWMLVTAIRGQVSRMTWKIQKQVLTISTVIMIIYHLGDMIYKPFIPAYGMIFWITGWIYFLRSCKFHDNLDQSDGEIFMDKEAKGRIKIKMTFYAVAPIIMYFSMFLVNAFEKMGILMYGVYMIIMSMMIITSLGIFFMYRVVQVRYAFLSIAVYQVLTLGIFSFVNLGVIFMTITLYACLFLAYFFLLYVLWEKKVLRLTIIMSILYMAFVILGYYLPVLGLEKVILQNSLRYISILTTNYIYPLAAYALVRQIKIKEEDVLILGA